MLSKTHQKLKK